MIYFGNRHYVDLSCGEFTQALLTPLMELVVRDVPCQHVA